MRKSVHEWETAGVLLRMAMAVAAIACGGAASADTVVTNFWIGGGDAAAP